jgi:hypothetical protein
VNEKVYWVIITVLLSAVIVLSIFLGRGDIQRPAGIADTDQQLERALAECRRELEQERTTAAGLRSVRERERLVITGIAESTRQAGADAQAAVELSGGAASGLQKIIKQMEIYNRYVGDIERRLAGYGNIPGGE